MAFTILSMTVSLAAVFLPMLFMGGMIGRLLHEFAVTIGVAILVSGFVSISLTPMMCSRFLTPPHEQPSRPACTTALGAAVRRRRSGLYDCHPGAPRLRLPRGSRWPGVDRC